MSLLGPFKITPATALKIYQHFGPACVDILKKCPYDLCQISGFGFKRVDGIVRKTDNRLHSTERIKGAVLYTLENKWLSPLPKEAKVKLGTAELIMPHAKIDRQGKVHRHIPELNVAVQTENAAAVMPNGKKPVYDTKKSQCHKVIPLAQALELLKCK